MNRNVASLKFQCVPVSGSTCSACGESFENPLLAMVFNESVVEEYYACPKCLSKVASFRQKPDVEGVDETENVQAVAKALEETAADVAEVENGVEAGCLHELGYLKRRPKNTPIPEECLTCSKMIDCMY
jgi:DNA-directed RNA polymerase subunit RPC12/RpoP